MGFPVAQRLLKTLCIQLIVLMVSANSLVNCKTSATGRRLACHRCIQSAQRQHSFLSTIKHHKLSWFGHVCHLSTWRTAKAKSIQQETVERGYHRGRPRKLEIWRQKVNVLVTLVPVVHRRPQQPIGILCRWGVIWNKPATSMFESWKDGCCQHITLNQVLQIFSWNFVIRSAQFCCFSLR